MMSRDERIKERYSKRMLIKLLLNGSKTFSLQSKYSVPNFKYVFLEGTRTLHEVLLL